MGGKGGGGGAQAQAHKPDPTAAIDAFHKAADVIEREYPTALARFEQYIGQGQRAAIDASTQAIISSIPFSDAANETLNELRSFLGIKPLSPTATLSTRVDQIMHTITSSPVPQMTKYSSVIEDNFVDINSAQSILKGLSNQLALAEDIDDPQQRLQMKEQLEGEISEVRKGIQYGLDMWHNYKVYQNSALYRPNQNTGLETSPQKIEPNTVFVNAEGDVYYAQGDTALPNSTIIKKINQGEKDEQARVLGATAENIAISQYDQNMVNAGGQSVEAGMPYDMNTGEPVDLKLSEDTKFYPTGSGFYGMLLDSEAWEITQHALKTGKAPDEFRYDLDEDGNPRGISEGQQQGEPTKVAGSDDGGTYEYPVANNNIDPGYKSFWDLTEDELSQLEGLREVDPNTKYKNITGLEQLAYLYPALDNPDKLHASEFKGLFEDMYPDVQDIETRFATQYTEEPGRAMTGQEIQEKLESMPEYQFTFQQGMQALERTQAAKGQLQSGNAMLAASEFGQGLAQSAYSGHVARLAGLAGLNMPGIQTDVALQGNLGNVINQNQLLGGSAVSQSLQDIAKARQNAFNLEGDAELRSELLYAQLATQASIANAKIDAQSSGGGGLFGGIFKAALGAIF